ncbi:hypothetical protein HZA33_00335 [Candidatus Pacearchaeota archaeon]|nr:hypothetical protein [Candidatus Pacearchaeota archaeon]
MYEYLGGLARIEDYKKNIQQIVREAYKRKVGAVVIAGASGAPVGTFFKHVWKILYPNEGVPHLYSLEFVDKMLGIKHSVEIPELKKSEIEKIKRRLLINYPNLFRDMNKPILLLDEYATSGRTLRERKKLLSKLGANEVYTTALSVSHYLLDKVDITVDRRGNIPEWHKESRKQYLRKKLARDFKKLAEEISQESKNK